MKKPIILIFLNLIAFNLYSQNIAELYKKVDASVVTILTESKVLKEDHQMANDQGIGSGVLISGGGEILTAAHVVNDAEKITVRFLNGEEIPAKVIRSAPMPDLALIKLIWMPKEYTIASLGNSDETVIGEQVIVVGAPYGFEHSLSVGYISGKKDQKVRTSGFILNEFFQTDASINQGNSGGPMFNLKGEVIGISSYIISESGGFQGIGFAATVNLAKKVVVDVNRRWTGINGYFLDEKAAWILNVPINGGLLVESVVQFSPAYYAGLKEGFEKVIVGGQDMIVGGDIIISVNDFPLTVKAFKQLSEVSSETLNSKQESFFNQKLFKLQVLRGGKIKELTLKFKE
ncbi:S1C family serine protease [Flavivirga sp. 57AJ16]|uniref:S1C family serine protease n=1 Tax=Flavivirga sp. 57AJ16 TaxID=3025307 RepID=UPI0023667E9B|nr:trypsin-like peptidase domain-containing protein [Flavivirga sp. 57AJ16]MDD7886932.1 trypsin-like peptidase domain-containing protein [Flavivirga sp. 57AJ16]